MCVFCKIINGEIPCYKIYEDDEILAFLDIADDAIGHTLVIPKKHYENVLDIDSDALNKVMNVVKIISNHYVDNCGYTGVNIMNASGIDAQQSVFHLRHLHHHRMNVITEVLIWKLQVLETLVISTELSCLRCFELMTLC
jgi:histidine triad (HIT) family protein